jgi:hypothetical protein
MLNETMEQLIFQEKQKFKQKWVWAIVLLSSLTVIISFGWGFIQQLIYKKPYGNNPMGDIPLLILGICFILIFGFGLPALFAATNLTTEIRTDGIYYKFFPFHMNFHRIGFNQIKSYEIRKYSPIREYGGWGIRYSFKGGKAYNVYGNIGLQLVLTTGQKILLGTQKGEEWKGNLDRLIR